MVKTARKVSGEGTILWESAETSLQEQPPAPEECRGLRSGLRYKAFAREAAGSSPVRTGRCCCSDSGLAVCVISGWVHV